MMVNLPWDQPVYKRKKVKKKAPVRKAPARKKVKKKAPVRKAPARKKVTKKAAAKSSVPGERKGAAPRWRSEKKAERFRPRKKGKTPEEKKILKGREAGSFPLDYPSGVEITKGSDVYLEFPSRGRFKLGGARNLAGALKIAVAWQSAFGRVDGMPKMAVPIVGAGKLPMRPSCPGGPKKGYCGPKTRKGSSNLYTEGACTYTGVEKKLARERQLAAWKSGFRPKLPPRPYCPEPRMRDDLEYEFIGRDPKTGKPGVKLEVMPDLNYDPDLRNYDKIIVHMSGGKDSLGCLLHVLEILKACKIDYRKVVECWHQAIDGDPRPGKRKATKQVPGSANGSWDWPITEDYCVAICDHLEIPLLFQWREEGITGGVFLKAGDKPKRKFWEEPKPGRELVCPRKSVATPSAYAIKVGGQQKKGRANHRLRWPSPGSLSGGRWCSPYVKIEVADGAIANQERFHKKKVLEVSGERAEESANRAGYAPREFRPAHGSRGRWVERWRPCLNWCEIEVWALIERWNLTMHPAYYMGFGRLSCLTCVFATDDMWATIKSSLGAVGRKRYDLFCKAEKTLASVQKKAKKSGWPAKVRSGEESVQATIKELPLAEFAASGVPFRAAKDLWGKFQYATNHKLPANWRPDQFRQRGASMSYGLPAGAFGEDAGPS